MSCMSLKKKKKGLRCKLLGGTGGEALIFVAGLAWDWVRLHNPRMS